MNNILDARGLACPRPVVETRKMLRTIGSGQLEVIVDNEIAVQNLAKMAEQTGLSYDTETVSANEYRFKITLGEQAKTTQVQSTVSERIKQGTVIVIGTNKMGDGDPTLGEILLKGFIYALTEQEEYPEKILFYNSGVKLTCEGSEAVEDLRKLAAKGVEIFSCGACLDFYQLTAQLQVGEISNMYDTARNLLNATQIIRP